MIWFVLLGIAALVTAFAAVTGIKPKGTQHLAHTRLIGVARIILVFLILVVIGVYMASRGATHNG